MITPIPIDDPMDPRIAAYRDIRERDLVGRDGQFIAEGKVVLQILLGASRHRPLSLLLAERHLPGLAPMLAAQPAEIPVYLASQTVLDAVAGFHIHRGILAHGQRAPLPSAAQLLDQAGRRAVVVVLFGIANHDNIGGIFRNAAAFGADAVLLDAHCCDPLYRKAIRVSVGATLMVPFARLDPAAHPLELLAKHHFTAVSLSPAGVTPLAALVRPDRVAALFGAEGPGLGSELLAQSRTVRIPMAGGFDSLNVATTSGIVLHHLACGCS